MITLDLPPQYETQLIQSAQQQGVSVQEYILAKLALPMDKKLTDKNAKLAELTGIVPLTTGKHTVTNEQINELRELYHV